MHSHTAIVNLFCDKLVRHLPYVKVGYLPYLRYLNYGEYEQGKVATCFLIALHTYGALRQISALRCWLARLMLLSNGHITVRIYLNLLVAHIA